MIRLARPRPALRFDAEQRRRHKVMNFVHSALLLAGMAAILFVAASSLWGIEIGLWAIAGGLLGFLFMPSVAPEWVMRAYRAQLLDRRRFPEGVALVEELSRRAGIAHVPRLYHLPSPMMNAFAVGSSRNAAIGVTAGLLERLDRRELAGVLAHEISHVRNNDLWIMALADMMSRLTSLMASVGIFMALLSLPLLLFGHAPLPLATILVLILAPTIGSLLQLALSRAREFDADLDAATLTRDPAGLASALRKLDRYQGRYWEEIILPGRRMPEPSLLRTHPPTEDRIARIMSLYSEAPQAFAQPTPIRLAASDGLRPCGRRPSWHWPGFWY